MARFCNSAGWTRVGLPRAIGQTELLCPEYAVAGVCHHHMLPLQEALRSTLHSGLCYMHR